MEIQNNKYFELQMYFVQIIMNIKLSTLSKSNRTQKTRFLKCYYDQIIKLLSKLLLKAHFNVIKNS